MLKSKPKATTPTTYKKLQTINSIESLLRTTGYILSINSDIIEDLHDFDVSLGGDDIPFTELTTMATKLEVTCLSEGSATCSVHLVQQPATCANAFAYSFEVGRGRYTKTTLAYLLKAVEFCAKYAGYTHVHFSNLSTDVSVEVAKHLGWEERDRYVNKRTDNELVDMRLAL